MYSRLVLLAAEVSSATALLGCATRDAAAPGINAQEMQVLVSEYYWHADAPPPRYTSEQLDALLRRSADSSLDGANAEQQASRVAVALTVIGDDRFSQALAHQSPKVKRAVAYEIQYFWTNTSLHYPKTEALLRPYT